MHSITWATATLLLSIPYSIAAPWQQTLRGSTCDNHVNDVINVQDSCPSPPSSGPPPQICQVVGPPPPCFPEGRPEEPPFAFLRPDCRYFATCYIPGSPFVSVKATGSDGSEKTCWATLQGLACTKNYIPTCQPPNAIAAGATAEGQPPKLVVSIAADLA